MLLFVGQGYSPQDHLCFAISKTSETTGSKFFRVIKFWMDESSGIAPALKTGVPTYQVEDEEGRIHLLLHFPIEKENEDRWCLWRPDQAGSDLSVRSHN